MGVPADCRYLTTHEWHRLDGKLVTIGITQFAADELTDITYVELPEVGATVTAGKPFGEIESVKATADLNSGVTGRVVEVNTRLTSEPELVNSDPFGAGWLIKVQPGDLSEFEDLLPAEAYERRITGQ